jgi:hypothetical protein
MGVSSGKASSKRSCSEKHGQVAASESQQWSVAFRDSKDYGTTEGTLHGRFKSPNGMATDLISVNMGSNPVLITKTQRCPRRTAEQWLNALAARQRSVPTARKVEGIRYGLARRV